MTAMLSIEPLADEQTNAAVLERELNWLAEVIDTRLTLYFQGECPYTHISEVPAPDLNQCTSNYAQLVQHYQMTELERLLLMLALAPHLRPQLLNRFLIQDQTIGREFIEFGGWKGQTHGGFLPTGETAAFLLAGNDLHQRLLLLAVFNKDHTFWKDGLLSQENGQFRESWLTAPLTVSNEFFQKLTTGHSEKPDFHADFPATRLETELDWEDLVLPDKVRDEIDHISTWITHQDRLTHDVGLNKVIKPGYRALFYGPPGTGKTLTASLLGKQAGLDVYRIDLSSVVSKYIGETEKNLENVFRQAQNRQWVLFFDEADALFGKRTATSSAHDKFANQEVSYLLQRIENFPGVVILATNLKANIDEAFTRRFQSITYFSMPDKHDRQELWEKALVNSDFVANDIDYAGLAAEYEIAGGTMINAIRFAAVHTLHHASDKSQATITQADLVRGISRELKKEGRTL